MQQQITHTSAQSTFPKLTDFCLERRKTRWIAALLSDAARKWTSGSSWVAPEVPVTWYHVVCTIMTSQMALEFPFLPQYPMKKEHMDQAIRF